MEKSIEAFVKIADDAATKAKNTCVVNLSWGYDKDVAVSTVSFDIMSKQYTSLSLSLIVCKQTTH
jgi:hypothetical protein